MELLNLDEIVAIPRSVSIKGVDYAIAEQTVEQMLVNLKMVNEMNKTEKGSQDEGSAILISMRELAYQILPDCPKDIIGSLTVRQLSALSSFASKPEEEIEAAVAEAEADAGEEADSGKQ